MGIDDQPKLFPDALGLPRFETASGPIVALARVDLETGKHFLFRYDYCPVNNFKPKFSGYLMIEVMKARGYTPGEYECLRPVLRRLANPQVNTRVFVLYPIKQRLARAVCFDGKSWKPELLPVMPGFVKPSDMFLFYYCGKRDNEHSQRTFRRGLF